MIKKNPKIESVNLDRIKKKNKGERLKGNEENKNK